MVHVVFAIPFAKENTLRFARAAADLPGVRLSVVSQDAKARFPADFLARLASFQLVEDAMDQDQLEAAVSAAWQAVGQVERLLGILEPLQEPLAVVRERLRIRGMDSSTARNFRDKARMKDLFVANDIGCARHHLATSGPEAVAAAHRIGFPLVVKPPAGAGAKATVRCADLAALQQALAATPPTAGRPVLLEEFVQGREYSFDTITLHGQPVFHNICSYHPTPLQVLENDWIQWCVVLPRDLSAAEFAPIFRAGPRALSVLGMWTGMSHMEWFRRADGSIAIGEVAARPPGAQFTSLIGYAHDRDMYRAYAELMVHERFVPTERRYAAGAAYLRAQGGGAKITAVHGLDEVRRELGAAIVELQAPQVGAPVANTYEGDGYVIVRHPDTRFVQQATQRLVAQVRVEAAR